MKTQVPQLRKIELRSYTPIGEAIASILLKANVNRSDIFPTCITCANFSHDAKELCKLVNMRPPARIIADGCPQYVDEIPF